MPEAEAIVWDEATFDVALKRIAADGVIEARGVRLSSDQLRRLLDQAPKDPEHPARRLLREADFRGATFDGEADFRGATFDGEADFTGATFSGVADFEWATFRAAARLSATFDGDASFSQATFGAAADFRATFGGDAHFLLASFQVLTHFGGATFVGEADFTGATFGEIVTFSSATFRGDASFSQATFSGFADVGRATFGGEAHFGGATFSGAAGFFEATFGGAADFGDASFHDDADFGGASFGGDASFSRATFNKSFVRFGGATFGGNAIFGETIFEQARQLGPVLVFEELGLDRVLFAQPVRIEVSAQRASFASAVFRAGADVFVRWAEVSVEDADFAGSSLMAELPEPAGPDGEPSFLGREQPWADGGWVCHLNAPPAGFTPRVVSARRAKVARLTLSGVDLRACRFAGTHGIDGLRLERVQFAQPPSNRWRLVRWTRRQTVAEEHHWRAEHGHGPSWYEGEVRAPDWLPQASKPPEPEQIAGIYRALRKGREDNKDEPGAADFYYGEMEMRRQKEQTSFDVLLEAAGDRKTQVVEVVRVATRLGQKEAKALVDEASKPVKEDVDRDEADKLRADLEKAGAQVEVKPSKNEEEATRWERRILWLYWLVSGYGLRASRALLALAITIALLGAVPLDLWGFRPDRSYGRALLFALESSISLLRAPEAKLTAGGEVIQIALRLAGPLFFGLALLSLRGRVKR